MVLHLETQRPAPLPYIPSSLEELPCSEDNWGQSSVYDFSAMTRLIQIKVLRGETEGHQDFWDIMDPDDLRLEYQDFLENNHLDQEEIMANNITESGEYNSLGHQQSR